MESPVFERAKGLASPLSSPVLSLPAVDVEASSRMDLTVHTLDALASAVMHRLDKGKFYTPAGQMLLCASPPLSSPAISTPSTSATGLNDAFPVSGAYIPATTGIPVAEQLHGGQQLGRQFDAESALTFATAEIGTLLLPTRVATSCRPLLAGAITNPPQEVLGVSPKRVGSPRVKTSKLPDSHIFEMLSKAYANAIAADTATTLLLLGESGSGKTEMLYTILKFFRTVSTSNAVSYVLPHYRMQEACQQLSHTILKGVDDCLTLVDAFTASPAPFSVTSSRSLSIVRLGMSATGAVVTADLQTLCVDRWRTCKQHVSAGSDIFNVLLQLVFGAPATIAKPCYVPLIQQLWEADRSCTRYATPMERGAYAVKFQNTCDAMDRLGFTNAAQITIFRVLAAVILLNEAKGPPTHGLDDEGSGSCWRICMTAVSDLLDIPRDALEACLQHRQTASAVRRQRSRHNVGRSKSGSHLEEVKEGGPGAVAPGDIPSCTSVEALATAIYSRLWAALVTHMQAVLTEQRDAALSVMRPEFLHICETLQTPLQRTPDVVRSCSLEMLDYAFAPVGWISIIDGPGLRVPNPPEPNSPRTPLRKSRASRFPTPSQTTGATEGPALYESGDLICSYVAEKLLELHVDTNVRSPLSRLEANNLSHPTIGLLRPINPILGGYSEVPLHASPVGVLGGTDGLPSCVFDIINESISYAYPTLDEEGICNHAGQACILDAHLQDERRLVDSVVSALTRTNRVLPGLLAPLLSSPSSFGFLHSNGETHYSARGMATTFASNDQCCFSSDGARSDSSEGGVSRHVWAALETSSTSPLVATICRPPASCAADNDDYTSFHECSTNIVQCVRNSVLRLCLSSMCCPPSSPIYANHAACINNFQALTCITSPPSKLSLPARILHISHQLASAQAAHTLHMGLWHFPVCMTPEAFVDRYKLLIQVKHVTTEVFDSLASMAPFVLSSLSSTYGATKRWYTPDSNDASHIIKSTAEAVDVLARGSMLADAVLASGCVMLSRNFEASLERALTAQMRRTHLSFVHLQKVCSVLHARSKYRRSIRRIRIIQAVVRGRKVRSKYVRIQRAATVLTRWRHAGIIRYQFLVKRALATQLQRLFRNRKLLQRLSTTCLQIESLLLLVRGSLFRSRATLRLWSLETISTALGGWIAAYRLRKLRYSSATAIQRVLRGVFCRRKYPYEVGKLILIRQGHVVMAFAHRLGCIWRMKPVRRRYVAQLRAITRLQTWWRDTQLVPRLKQLVEQVFMLRRVLRKFHLRTRLARLVARKEALHTSSVLCGLLQEEAKAIIARATLNGFILPPCGDGHTLHKHVKDVVLPTVKPEFVDCVHLLDFDVFAPVSRAPIVPVLQDVISGQWCAPCIHIDLTETLHRRVGHDAAPSSPKRNGRRNSTIGVDTSSALFGDRNHIRRGTISSCSSPIAALSQGLRHAIAIGSDGRCYMWGENGNGQCGFACRNTSPTKPASSGTGSEGRRGSTSMGEHVSTALTRPTLAMGSFYFKTVAAGPMYSAALTLDGRVFICGSGCGGKGGESVRFDKFVWPITGIEAGWNHMCAIDELGQLFAWGGNTSHQCSEERRGEVISPVLISLQTRPVRVRPIGIGRRSSAITSVDTPPEASASTLLLIGMARLAETAGPLPPSLSAPGNTIVRVSCGGLHTVVLDSAGCVWVWGGNQYGQCGGGSNRFQVLPSPLLPSFHPDIITC
jgi:hypothetical protein